MKKYRFLSLLLAGCLLFSGCADWETDDRGSSYDDDEDKGKDKDKDKDKDDDVDDDDDDKDGSLLGGLTDRYETQKKYTWLMDAAQTVSNFANVALSEGKLIEAIDSGVITGTMTSATELTVTVGGVTINGPTGIAANETASGDSALMRAAKTLHAHLVDILPEGATFFAKYENGGVYGVIFSEDPKNPITGEVNVYIVEGYSGAYEDAKHNPIGVSGKYTPK